MCKSLRYYFSHCLHMAMTKLEDANREVNMHSSVRYLGFLASINLVVALSMGLYVRWDETQDPLILVIFILGLFVLGIAIILYYYFSMEAAGLSLSHLWFGFLLGLLCFSDNDSFKDDVKEQAFKYLLLASIVIRTLWALVARICGCIRYRPTLLTSVEFLELVGFAIASTTMQMDKCLDSWTFTSALLIVLPFESLAHGLFYELGNCLGGTCVGYAVVIPTSYCSPDGQPALLPPEHVQELNLRSTGMLNAIQRFFAYHMIETYGCDYSTSGLSFDTVQTKLKSFMELRTVDGPRHDTYILYYSGHSHSSGEWALAGGDTLRLETVLDWWMEKNSSFCSRLLIVLDCEHPMSWVKEVRKVSNQYIAVQGAEMAKFVDVEETDPPQLGDFTKEWVEYNCNPDHNISWSEKGRTVRAVYGVSKCWSDYSLHLPTESDVAKHWVTYFPRVTYPVVHLANWCGGLNLFWMCKVCFKCFRRFKMSWFPPAVLDTGHGFKLVRS